ncbi:C1 family peptidase [Methanobrevibacter sp.]|uniref:C1 family peptidase n=1 Tax=Methanobrevibacter sp. TaxID=66852 RepID=UPI0026DEC941|nr:C1 family peptidase [Methanobrevibacter sp.]MDO5823268.1 C1 family peptidase [Methanobrevibacter sp.]
MHKLKKSAVIFLIALIFIIPTAYASDNQTELSLNGDEGVLSDSYYFDAGVADDMGNGSIDNPYKRLTKNRIKDDSTIYLNNGVYDNGVYKQVSNLTLIGKSCENTVIGNLNLEINGYLLVYNVTFIDCKITSYGNVSLFNSIFKDSSSSNGVLTLNSKTFLNITNCTFTNNSVSDYGGVICANNSNINIFNSVFDGNSAEKFAGAIYCDNRSMVTIKNSNFTNNHAKNDAGGAIYAINSTIVADYLNISNSSATFGGAITSLNSNLHLTNFKSSNNKAKYRGGSIYSIYANQTIVNSTFENNTALDGGAIFINYPFLLNLTSNKLIKNNAFNIGGAIYILSDKNNSIFNNTFLNNSAVFNNDSYETELPNLAIGNGDYILIYHNQPFIGDLPSSYDLRTLNQVTPVKNQGSGGNCWAFAALASLESCILKATGKTFDLSEENMKNLMALYSDYGWNMNPNNGGFPSMAIGYLTSWLGAINESDDKYYSLSALSSVFNSFIHIQNILFLNRKNYTDNDEIKRAIIEHGAVSTSIYWKTDYQNGKSYYNDNVSSANHAVAIVGWDDNYSRDNFNKPAPGDGAWIIKNSWGKYAGENGFYYVSYYDLSMARINDPSKSYTFVLSDSIKYDKNYQYDISGQTDYLFSSSSSVWYKNRFTATDEEYLTAISTYFQKETSWNLYVYVNGELRLTQSGSAGASYKTIELDQFIPLKKGDVFEVAIKLTADGDVGVPISEYFSLSHLLFGKNVSYISYDGENWFDLFDFKGKYLSHTYHGLQVACIKAFTVLNKINSTIALIVDDLNPVELTAIILNQYGNPIKTGKVTFNIEGTDYAADVINGISKFYYKFKNNESKVISASFSDVGYIGSSFNMTIIPRQGSIMADDSVYYYNETIYYSALLLDNNMKPVSNREIKFKINNTEYVALTNNEGIATVSLKLDLNSYDIEIGLKHDEFSLAKKITVKSSIKLPTNKRYAYNSKYYAALFDAEGNPMSNCNLKMIINDASKYVTTDSNGYINYNIALNPGSYSIIIINPKTNEQSTQTISVVSRITQNKDLTMYYGAGSYYKVKVVDDNGKVKKNLKVSFKVNGKTYYKYTNEKGYASIKISLKSGKYTILTTYKGYKVSNKITVKPTVITKNIKIKKGKTGKFTAKLISSKGKVLKYKKITFKFKGKTYIIKTNKYGIATLKIPKIKSIKKYSVTTSYGSQKYKNTISIVK